MSFFFDRVSFSIANKTEKRANKLWIQIRSGQKSFCMQNTFVDRLLIESATQLNIFYFFLTSHSASSLTIRKRLNITLCAVCLLFPPFKQLRKKLFIVRFEADVPSRSIIINVKSFFDTLEIFFRLRTFTFTNIQPLTAMELNLDARSSRFEFELV